jgi:hypothetical protein
MANLITKQSLREGIQEKQSKGIINHVKNPVSIINTRLSTGVRNISDAEVMALRGASEISSGVPISLSGKYQSGFDVPIGGRPSINERMRKGTFSLKGQSLADNWTDFIDAMRLDITMRKEAVPTIRQFIYDVISMPNATKDIRPTELYPTGIVFNQNNGEGQAVTQGANMAGGSATIPMEIYAAGFTWTLLAELFDSSYDLTRINDGVAVGFNAALDNNAILPILNGTYTGAKATAAATTPTGGSREELLYNTIENALDDLGNRTDPVTNRKIDVTGSVILASPLDARHISRVIGGQLNTPADSKNYGALNEIANVLAYDGETIDMPNESVTYTGCTDGTAYLIKPNRYFKIGQKRGLTMEMDDRPDVATLSREQRAWYFVEAYYNSVGISSFVQKITLPTW